MKNTVIIYTPKLNSKRIKIFIPYMMKKERELLKAMNTSFWHPNQKLWSVVNTQDNMSRIKTMFNGKFKIESEKKEFTPIPQRKLNKKAEDALFALERAIVLKQYSRHTMKTYKAMFTTFLMKFMEYDLLQISKDQIEGFIYELIKKHNYGESAQNQMINAIKFYYEVVLGKPRTFYDIKRPKKAQNIPNVLSEEEVFRIINAPKNLKHKTILWTISGWMETHNFYKMNYF